MNDVVFGDQGDEYEDLPANAPTLNGEPGLQSCLDTASCILSATPPCANATTPVSCYCGSAIGNACATPGAANGPCLNVIANGLDIPPSDPSNISKHLVDAARPAGKALAIFACAEANDCTACLH